MNIHERLNAVLEQSENDKFVSEMTLLNKHLETLDPDCVSSGFGSASVCHTLLAIVDRAIVKRDDFQAYANLALAVLECFDIFLKFGFRGMFEKENRKTLKRLCPSLLYLASGNVAQNVWTNPKVSHKAKHVLNLLKQCFGAETYSQWLTAGLDCDDSVTAQTSALYGQYLALLQPKLTKETWTKNPFAKASFIWTVVHVKFPNLSEYLHQVLPFPLTMADDFNIENKILGVQCLHHVVENVSKEELRWYGRAEVVYDALKHQMYTKHAGLISVLMPALLSILSVVEKDQKPNVYRDVNRYDNIFKMILFNCETENNIHIRRALTTHLPLFVKTLGISAARHTKTVIRVATNYLEIYDGPEETARLNMLNVLKCFILVTWPCIPTHTNVILKCLLRFLYDVATDKTVTSESVKQQMTSNARECLRLLHFCSPKVVLDGLRSISNSGVTGLVTAIVKPIYELISKDKSAL